MESLGFPVSRSLNGRGNAGGCPEAKLEDEVWSEFVFGPLGEKMSLPAPNQPAVHRSMSSSPWEQKRHISQAPLQLIASMGELQPLEYEWKWLRHLQSSTWKEPGSLITTWRGDARPAEQPFWTLLGREITFSWVKPMMFVTAANLPTANNPLSISLVCRAGHVTLCSKPMHPEWNLTGSGGSLLLKTCNVHVTRGRDCSWYSLGNRRTFSRLLRLSPVEGTLDREPISSVPNDQ